MARTGAAASSDGRKCRPSLCHASRGDGEFGKPGAGFLYLNWDWACRKFEELTAREAYGRLYPLLSGGGP